MISVLVLDTRWAFVEYSVHLEHKIVEEDIEDYKEAVDIQEECLGLGKAVVQVVDFHRKDYVLITFLLSLLFHTP